MITTVTGKNQITIPAKIATTAGIQPGARIDWTLRADGVLMGRLLPSRGELARKVAGMGRAWLGCELEEMTENSYLMLEEGDGRQGF